MSPLANFWPILCLLWPANKTFLVVLLAVLHRQISGTVWLLSLGQSSEFFLGTRPTGERIKLGKGGGGN